MRFFVLTISLLTITLFLGGCWHGPVEPPLQPPTGNNSGTATSTTEVDTSDWQTYRNEEYGFGFRYPEKWNVNVYTDQYNTDKFIGVVGPNPYCEESVCSKLYTEVSLSILVTTSSLDKFLAEHMEALAEPLKDSTSEKADDYKKIYEPLGGFTGTLVTDIGIFKIFYYLNLDNSNNLYITFDKNSETLKIFSNIINSIKVIH